MKCSGCRQYRVDIRHIVHVRGKRHSNDLNIVTHSLVEQGPQRPVDQAGYQCSFFTGSSATLDKASGDFADCILTFLVIASQGEKIEFEARIRAHGRRSEDGGVSSTEKDGTAGLLRHAPRLNGDYSTFRQGNLDGLNRHLALFFCSFTLTRRNAISRERQSAPLSQSDPELNHRIL